MAKRVLGKGLGAIISSSETPAEDFEKHIASQHMERVINLDINLIYPNPDQPRENFDHDALKGLADSIKNSGLLHPIIVRRSGAEYFVVAGERRLRASKLAGLKKIKAITIETGEEQSLTYALLENIQRENLNPIEEAKAYRVLINRFKLKQQDVAHKVGKDRATITNLLRLLNLPEEIQTAISEKTISTGHAKLLLSVQDQTKRSALFKQIKDQELSVRALEQIVASGKIQGPSYNNTSAKTSPGSKPAHIKKMEDRLMSRLGTRVEIKHSGKKGKIEIAYYSLEDFERIIDLIK